MIAKYLPSRETIVAATNHLKQLNDVLPSPSLNTEIITMEDTKKSRKTSVSTPSTGKSSNSGGGTQKHRNRFINSIRNLTNRMESKYNSNSKLNSAPATVTTSRKASTSYDSYDSTISDTTMFPFDREAIDYKRIQQECFAVEDDYDDDCDDDDDDTERTRFPFNFDTDTSNYDSDNGVDFEKPLFDSPSNSYKQLQFDKYGYELNNCERQSLDNDMNQNIFQHYAKIAQQQESVQMYEKRPHSKRSSSGRSHRKQYADHQCGGVMSKSCGNAFSSPNKSDLSAATDSCYTVSKFDQIANKFHKIPAKSSSDAFHNLTNITAQSSDYPSVHHAAAHTLHYHHPYHSGATVSSSAEKILATSPVPNLRIDFFTETSNVPSSSAAAAAAAASSSAKSQQYQANVDDDEQLDDCQRNASTSIASSMSNGCTVGSINVTSNPMDGAVCTQPRATIVVQQVRMQKNIISLRFNIEILASYACAYIIFR